MSLFLVQGLSLSGKKALVAGAKEALKDAPKYAFPPRIATRPDPVPEAAAVYGETVIEDAEFTKASKADEYCSVWKDGSRNVGIRTDTLTKLLAEGSKVVVIVPEKSVEEIVKKFKDANCKIVWVSCSETTLTNRVKTSGSKSAKDDKKLSARIKKDLERELKGDNVVKAVNDTSLDDGIKSFLDALGFDPVTDVPPLTDEDQEAYELKVCPPQEYLRRTLYPLLAPALTIIEQIRPENPVDALGILLLKSAKKQREEVKKLIALKEQKTQLREELRKEYSVVGRI